MLLRRAAFRATRVLGARYGLLQNLFITLLGLAYSTDESDLCIRVASGIGAWKSGASMQT